MRAVVTAQVDESEKAQLFDQIFSLSKALPPVSLHEFMNEVGLPEAIHLLLNSMKMLDIDSGRTMRSFI